MQKTFRRKAPSISVFCSDLPVPKPCRRRFVLLGKMLLWAGEDGSATHIWAPGTAILTWLFCDRVIVKRVLSNCGSVVKS